MSTTRQLGRILRVDESTIQRWADRGWLACSRDARNRRHFEPDAIRQLARNRPQLFAAASADQLAALLQDDDLARSVAASQHYRHGIPRRIRCRETGRVFESIAAAARTIFVTHGSLRQALRTGGTCAECHWEYQP